MKVILTFDLKEGDDYDAAYEVLERIGLHRITPNKKIELPNTTVLGELPDDLSELSAAELRDLVAELLLGAGVHPTKILGGFLQDWAATGPTQPLSERLSSLQRVIARYLASSQE